MKRNLSSTSMGIAIALIIALLPAESVNAVDAEVHYTVTFVCIVGPNPGVVGEWTQPCQGEMYGWGAAPHSCTLGNPNYCCETDVTFGEPCE